MDTNIDAKFDIKKKRISMLENYGENFQKNDFLKFIATKPMDGSY